MVIDKNSENKRSLYLNYVNDIIKSLENEPENWSLDVRGSSNNKKIYADGSFSIIANLEEKKITVFKRKSISSEEPKLLLDMDDSTTTLCPELWFVFDGLMISNISLLDQLICTYDDKAYENKINSCGVFFMEWDSREIFESKILFGLKLFLFDSIFSDRFHKENIKNWFCLQQDILFSDSISVKSIFSRKQFFEANKKNFDKNILKILGKDLCFDN
jgi:hypothetical protein